MMRNSAVAHGRSDFFGTVVFGRDGRSHGQDKTFHVGLAYGHGFHESTVYIAVLQFEPGSHERVEHVACAVGEKQVAHVRHIFPTVFAPPFDWFLYHRRETSYTPSRQFFKSGKFGVGTAQITQDIPLGCFVHLSQKGTFITPTCLCISLLDKLLS